MTKEKKPKGESDSIDKDLKELYTRAKKEKLAACCPHCMKKHDVEVGGDFGMLKTAMELRLKYEQIKQRRDPDDSGDGSFFKEKE